MFFHHEGIESEMADSTLKFMIFLGHSMKHHIAPVVFQRALCENKKRNGLIRHVSRALFTNTHTDSLSAVYQTKPYEL